MAGPDFTDMPTIDQNATNQCVPTIDGDYYIFSITDDIEDCGTSVTNNGTHVTYENAVQSTVGTENSIISRIRNMKINFSCFFELEMTLSVADAIKPRIQHFEVFFRKKMVDFLPDFLVEKIIFAQKIFLPEKIIFCANIFFTKILLCTIFTRKNLWPKKFVRKNIWPKKSSAEKIFGRKKFWPKID